MDTRSFGDQKKEPAEAEAMAGQKVSKEKCTSCLELFDLDIMFKCTTCIEESKETVSLPFHCNLCILSHVRRDHEILNDKALKPAICEIHKNLCSMFCSTCQLTLCSNCISVHVNHSIMPIKERASQTRAKIFDLISDLDSSEKKVRGTLDRIHANKQKRVDGYEKLVQLVSLDLEVLKQNLLNHIEVEHQKTIQVEKDAKENYEMLLKFQSNLRELLSSLDMEKAEQLNQFEESVLQIKTKEAELELCEIQGDDYNFSETTKLVLSKYVENIEMPIVAQDETCYVYSKRLESRYSGNLYSVEKTGCQISVHRCQFELHGNEDAMKMDKRKLGVIKIANPRIKIQAFFLENLNASPSILIFIPEVARLFDIANKKFIDIEINLESHNIPLFFVSLENDVAEFVFWDRTKNQIRQSNQPSIEYNCEFMPRAVNGCHDSTFVHLVNQDNDVVEIQTSRQSSANVSLIGSITHRVEQISCISHIKNNVLIIWSLSTRTLTFLYRPSTSSGYSLSHLIPFGCEFNNHSALLADKNLVFLVSAKTQDKNGQWVDKNVFMIKDTSRHY